MLVTGYFNSTHFGFGVTMYRFFVDKLNMVALHISMIVIGSVLAVSLMVAVPIYLCKRRRKMRLQRERKGYCTVEDTTTSIQGS
jgi:hypothetical protein